MHLNEMLRDTRLFHGMRVGLKTNKQTTKKPRSFKRETAPSNRLETKTIHKRTDAFYSGTARQRHFAAAEPKPLPLKSGNLTVGQNYRL